MKYNIMRYLTLFFYFPYFLFFCKWRSNEVSIPRSLSLRAFLWSVRGWTRFQHRVTKEGSKIMTKVAIALYILLRPTCDALIPRLPSSCRFPSGFFEPSLRRYFRQFSRGLTLFALAVATQASERLAWRTGRGIRSLAASPASYATDSRATFARPHYTYSTSESATFHSW